MKDWGIKKQIDALSYFSIGIVSLLAISSFGMAVLMSGIFGDYRSAARQSMLVSEIERNLSAMRLASAKYRLDRSPENFDEVIAESRIILDVLSKVPERFANRPEMIDAFSMIDEQINSYVAGFQDMSTLQSRREELASVIRTLGPKARKQLTDVMDSAFQDADVTAAYYAGRAQQELLLGRYYTGQFLLSNLPTHLDDARSHYQTAEVQIGDLLRELQNPRRRELATTTLRDLGELSEALEQISEVIFARNEARASIDSIGPTVQDSLRNSLAQVEDTQNELGPKAERTMGMTRVLVLVLGIAGVIIGFFVARQIVSRILAGMNQTVSTVSALAGGDLGIEIKGAEKDHELGKIAKALEVFRDNARESQRLAEENERSRAETEAAKEENRLREEADAKARSAADKARAEKMQLMISAVSEVVSAASEGDFSQRITQKFDEEQFNSIVTSLNELVGSIEAGVAETARVMARIATGDLSDRMHGDFRGIFAELKSNVNETIDTLGNLVVRISGQCDSLGGAASQMTDQANELARRAEQQAASLEETSAAMEEISASARSSAEGASTAAEFAQDASVRVDDAGQVVAAAVSAMADIRAASNRINEIVAVIDGIAFQTNLLALNASVEAARAGSAGKGFAVVATEVRALAQRSSEASKDIKGLIEESANQVRKGVELVEQTGTTLEEIMGGVGQMATTMQELTTTAREQATGVSEVTSAITQLDAITQKNAALSENSRDTAAKVNGESDAMRNLVSTFRTEASSDLSGNRSDGSAIAAE